MKRFSALDTKLLRDIWHMRGQAIAVGIIVACGVAIMVMALGTLSTLRASRDAYYERYRFADVFASVRRAPENSAAQLREIDGVQTVETRIVRLVILRIEGLEEPANAQIVSLPDDGESTLNRIVLFEGRYPEAHSPREIIISNAFAEANGLATGDTVEAVINGRLRTLSIVGIGDSPEFIYALGPGTILPDDRLFGIFWMRRPALEAAFDLDGAFNNVTLTVAPGTDTKSVIDEVDDVLAPYGGTGAFDREDQLSNAFVESEMRQLKTMARIIPAVFLVVSAILIHSILNRLIQTERQQIGLIKAFGYSRWEIAWHYLKLAIAITAGGVVAGYALGFVLENLITRLYAETFRIPDLTWRIDPFALVVSAGAALGAGIAGAMSASLNAASLSPSEAMSPAPPVNYQQRWLRYILQMRWLDEPTRLILRHIFRFPARTGANLFGVAAAVMLLVGTLFTFDSIDDMLDQMFFRTNSHDASVTFFEARNDTVVEELARLPGVVSIQGVRDVPARLESTFRSERISITGLPQGGDLRRLLSESGTYVDLPPTGIALSSQLAAMLDVTNGDTVTAHILDGTRPVADLPVTAIVDEQIGTPAFMDLAALNTLMRQAPTVSGAFLKLDPEARTAFEESIIQRPGIAGVSLRAAAIESFEETLQETIYIMMAIYAVIGGAIAAGVVYNAARISLTERGRELASLRVLGFTNQEVGYILLGELALIAMVGIPIGCLCGVGLAHLIATSMATELYRIPVSVDPSTLGVAALIVLVSSTAAALFVVQRVRSLDLIAVLKTRE
ncbi:MAG: FtsX-like permease family protein [Hyphomonas sp.]|uniref:ABC transporter permease n=1 Tax=Hyphomonas sp. TaxID=87 RepID=UPI00352820C4